MRANFRDRIFAAVAYLFGVPALFIVLTENRSRAFLGHHGAQAFFLWSLMLALFFSLRALIDWLWSQRYVPALEKLELLAVAVMGVYVLYCAGRCLLGRVFTVLS